METAQIIHEITKLPSHKRMLIAEHIIHLNNQEVSLEKAAEALYNDYKNDSALTEFTNLDCEIFYETR